jgi:hypothetical protein
MEIDITSLADLNTFPLSHSQAEGGATAGRDTWNASLEQATETALLDTPEKLEAFRDWTKDFGAWDDEERAAWTPQECNALFIQWIAGGIRECPAILEGVTFEERATTEARWNGDRDENGALISSDGNRFIDVGTVEWWHSTDDEPDMETGPFESRSAAYADACPQHEPRADTLEGIDWPEYETQASEGRISSNLFRADDGRIFFSLCH